MTTQANCQVNGPNATRRESFVPLIEVIALLGIFVVGLSLWMFPWEVHRTHTMELLPATMGELSEASQPVSVSRERFLTLARGEQITMAVEERNVITVVVYEVILKGTSFRYYDNAPSAIRYSTPGEYEIRDGVLTLTYARDKEFIVFAVLVGILGGFFVLFAVVGGFLEWWGTRTATS